MIVVEHVAQIVYIRATVGWGKQAQCSCGWAGREFNGFLRENCIEDCEKEIDEHFAHVEAEKVR